MINMLKKIKEKMDKIIFKNGDFLQRTALHQKKKKKRAGTLELKNTTSDIRH